MQIIRFDSSAYIAASHERPEDPGVLKKVLARQADLMPGTLQMINWALLPAGKSFCAHYHEDMQEVFVMVQGQTTITIDAETAELHTGDVIIIPARAIHTMHNGHDRDAVYIAIGITRGTGGRTVVVDE